MKLANMTRTDYKAQIIKVIEINDKIVSNSSVIDTKTKQAFLAISGYTRDAAIGEKKNWSLTQARALLAPLLAHWNESIDVDTELFWIEIKKHSLDFERKEPLQYALNKGRFMRVDIGISAKNAWPALKKMEVIRKQYSKAEIEKIDNIISTDEQTRLTILQKCLSKKSIPQSQYLKFGECMAYFAQCQLFDKYFIKSQVDELLKIWKNFK